MKKETKEKILLISGIGLATIGGAVLGYYGGHKVCKKECGVHNFTTWNYILDKLNSFMADKIKDNKLQDAAMLDNGFVDILVEFDNSILNDSWLNFKF